MFEYMKWTEVAQQIYQGIGVAIKNKRVTFDFAREMEGATELSTSEFGDEIIKFM